MNYIKFFTFLLLLSSITSFAQMQCKMYRTASFFPDDSKINSDKIEWYYLDVPENWENPSRRDFIRIAVVVLRKLSVSGSSNPVLFLEGGPGAGGINGVKFWANHPLRADSDIVLVDVRGTGKSFPKFCPDLGRRFFEVLAKDQSADIDQQQKVLAASACKDDLAMRNIDIRCYTSEMIAKDLDVVMKALHYDSWNVYGSSYGTYVAQVYANSYPDHVKSLILDSPISDISEYYNNNTRNYMTSLEKVFKACGENASCVEKYPKLEEKYFETIRKLSSSPITVRVDKSIVPTGKFTYNAEDFKIAIQQALYDQRLVRLLPLLIYEFNNGNVGVLASLVQAFSGALGLDYGSYYCVTCNEVIPHNSVSEFDNVSKQYKELGGGLAFYRSDFSVCDNWGNNHGNGKQNVLSNLRNLRSPVLIFSGEFDPITPVSNGITLRRLFKDVMFVHAPLSGHGPSFSGDGMKILSEFVKDPFEKSHIQLFPKESKVDFIDDVHLIDGISGMANSLGKLNILFLSPLLIAFFVLMYAVIFYSYTIFKEIRYGHSAGVLSVSIVLSSIFGIISICGLLFAIFDTASDNMYVLAFGLPTKFDFLITLRYCFVFGLACSIILFFMKIKTIRNVDSLVLVLFSLVLVNTYFMYWGII